MRPHCYICGSINQLTEDHIPPEGFFPPGQRTGLLTAPLCLTCHSPLSKMDEKMRVWLAAAGGASDAGKWIWKNKVLGSTFKRSPKLAAYIREKHFRPIIGSNGVLLGGRFTMPQGCAIPFVRRLTKGMLYLLHPKYDYFPDFLIVDQPQATPDRVAAVGELVSKLPQIEKGNGVFRAWHGITADTGDAGVCVYLFFETVCFLCFFGKSAKFNQRFAEGYSEEPGLPKYL
jgi:hypothetical protein